MANTRGPRQPGRRLLVSAVTSTLMYAAPIWARATKNGSYMQDGDSVQRLCALLVCCAFRTVSHDAALVISGDIPMLAVESANIRAGSTGVATAESLQKMCRELTIAKWQERTFTTSAKDLDHVPRLVTQAFLLAG
ncbi:uncharacterized protein [Drosophila suzukii]|uniref:Uncharacterized protein n=1 Tax=Drosophila suzukii TaxID=28584 RepID=A0ABM4U020_DROSZ